MLPPSAISERHPTADSSEEELTILQSPFHVDPYREPGSSSSMRIVDPFLELDSAATASSLPTDGSLRRGFLKKEEDGVGCNHPASTTAPVGRTAQRRHPVVPSSSPVHLSWSASSPHPHGFMVFPAFPFHGVHRRGRRGDREAMAASLARTVSFLSWYKAQGAHLRAVPTAEYFRFHVHPLNGAAVAAGGAGGTVLPPLSTAMGVSPLSITAEEEEEEGYWHLFARLLQDAQDSSGLLPDALPITSTPPHRRWFISQYAHLQFLLMNNPTLRVANAICLWLEAQYRRKAYRQYHPSCSSSASTLPGGQWPSEKGGHRTEGGTGASSYLPDAPSRFPRLQNTKEPVLLRELILQHIRGGELQRAVEAAVTCNDTLYSCVLSAAQLQTVEEPWMAETRVVPLFGEYGHGGPADRAQSWTGNDHRLENLSLLFEDSCKSRSKIQSKRALQPDGFLFSSSSRTSSSAVPKSEETTAPPREDSSSSDEPHTKGSSKTFAAFDTDGTSSHGTTEKGIHRKDEEEEAATGEERVVAVYDAVIAAALCGHLSVLEEVCMGAGGGAAPGFALGESNHDSLLPKPTTATPSLSWLSGSWQDLVWCYLRSMLVIAFTRHLMSMGQTSGVHPAYAAYVEKWTGSEEKWETAFCQQLVQGFLSRLRQFHYLTGIPEEGEHTAVASVASSSLTNTAVGGATDPQEGKGRTKDAVLPSPTVLSSLDQLQIRLMLQFLCSTQNTEVDWMRSLRSCRVTRLLHAGDSPSEVETFPRGTTPACVGPQQGTNGLPTRAQDCASGDTNVEIAGMKCSGGKHATHTVPSNKEDEEEEEVERRLLHTFLLLDTAYRESLIPHSVQIYSAEEMCMAMCRHAAHLALLPLRSRLYVGEPIAKYISSFFSSTPSFAEFGTARIQEAEASCALRRLGGAAESGTSLAVGLAGTTAVSSHSSSQRVLSFPHGCTLLLLLPLVLRLGDAVHRAHVYAAFLLAVREVTLELGETPRREVEEQEGVLVKHILKADPSPEVLRQHIPLQLDQRLCEKEELLTSHKEVERLLWESMHAISPAHMEEVVVKCLALAQKVWCATVKEQVDSSPSTMVAKAHRQDSTTGHSHSSARSPCGAGGEDGGETDENGTPQRKRDRREITHGSPHYVNIEVLRDIDRLLQHRVLPTLSSTGAGGRCRNPKEEEEGPSSASCPTLHAEFLSQQAQRWKTHRDAALFWRSFIRVYDLAVEHLQVSGELGIVMEARSQATAAASSVSPGTSLSLLADRQLRHRLRQREGMLLLQLLQEIAKALHTMKALRHHPVSSAFPMVCTAAVFLVEMVTENMIVSFMCHQPTGRGDEEGEDFIYLPPADYLAGTEEKEKEKGEVHHERDLRHSCGMTAAEVRQKNEWEKEPPQGVVPSPQDHQLSPVHQKEKEEEGEGDRIILHPIPLTHLRDPDEEERRRRRLLKETNVDPALIFLQTVFALVERLNEDGYLDPVLVPRGMASSLMTKIQALRVTYGQRQHMKEVQRILKESRR